jgi:hypothetical protein
MSDKRGRETPRESLLPENPRVLKMPRPPDKSPDHTRFFKRPIGNLPHQWERMLSMHVPSHQWLRRWEISKNLTQLIYYHPRLCTSYRDNDTPRPESTIGPGFRDYLMAPWKNALIVKVLGLTVGYSSPSAMEEDKRRFGYIFLTRDGFLPD